MRKALSAPAGMKSSSRDANWVGEKKRKEKWYIGSRRGVVRREEEREEVGGERRGHASLGRVEIGERARV